MACFLVVGCGGGGTISQRSVGSTGARIPAETETTITTSRVPPGQRYRGDGDADNPSDIDGNGDVDPGRDSDNDYPTAESYRFPDVDDKPIVDFGHRARSAQSRAITSIVTRYYAAGVAGEGAAACSLLLAAVARSVPESYGAGGPAYLHGARTCAAVVNALFSHFASELTEAPVVLLVRVEGEEARVVLASRKLRASHISLARQGGSWHIQELIGSPLP